MRRFRLGTVSATLLLTGAASFVTGAPLGIPAAADAVGVNLDQCKNGSSGTLSPCGWINGDLNTSNSHWSEGDGVPFRLLFRGLEPGPHSIHINYDFTVTGEYGYDILARYNISETVDVSADVPGAYTWPGGSADTAAIPHDPYFDSDSGPGNSATYNPENDLSSGQRVMTLYGGTITSIDPPTHSGSAFSSSVADMVVNFTTTGSDAALLWSGHLALDNADGWGIHEGSSSVSGAALHMRTQSLDGDGNKNQDRSIQVRAIAPRPPSLAITKTADAASVDAGDPIGFAVTVTNNGSGTALGATLSDPLPTGSGISWSISPAVSGCAISSGTLTCSFGDLAPGASRTVHVTSPTTFASAGTYDNTATAAAENNSPVSASASVVVKPPRISIAKTADASSVSAGDPIGFTVTVLNAGTGTADTVQVTDVLPSAAGLAWSIDGGTGASDCSIADGTLRCTFGSIAPSGSRTVHISSPTSAASCSTVSNTASVTTSNDGSDSATASVVVACPRLAVSKTADAASVSAGDPVGFTITVSNAGSGTARDVVLTDHLPTGAGISWSIDPAAAGCAISSGTLTCSFGDMAPTASRSIHVASPTTPESCGVLTNTASGHAANSGGSGGGGGGGTGPRATASITINCPSLAITKIADDTTVSSGDPIGFTVTVSNGGPGTVKSVTLADPLPAGSGITWSISPAVAGCSIADGTLTCAFGDLASGASRSVHVTSPTTGASVGSYENIATAQASNNPPVSATASVTVIPAGVAIQKTADSGTVTAGNSIGYTIRVTSLGPGVAANTTLTDVLPSNPGLSWSVDAGGESCSITSGTLRCTFGALAAGASASVHVTSSTTAATCGVVTNSASVATTNDGSATASASVTVVCPPVGIDLTKSGPSLAHVGDTVAYTLTVKTLTDVPLGDVVVTDPTCDAAPVMTGGDNENGILDPSETWTYTCSHMVTASDADPLVNTARAQGTDSLGRTVADTDSHSVDLIHPAIGVTKAATPTSGTAGTSITYTYVATNTGDTTLFSVSVGDDKLGSIGTKSSLAPGETATLTKPFTLGSAAVTNIATALGTDLLGKQVQATATATVTVVAGVKIVRKPPLAFTGQMELARLVVLGTVLFVAGLLMLAGARRRPSPIAGPGIAGARIRRRGTRERRNGRA